MMNTPTSWQRRIARCFGVFYLVFCLSFFSLEIVHADPVGSGPGAGGGAGAATATKDLNCNPNADPSPDTTNDGYCGRPKTIFGTKPSPGNIAADGICGVFGDQVKCTKKLLLGPCELFEAAVNANLLGAEGKSYMCQDFVDPVSLDTIKSTATAKCITIDPTGGLATGSTIDSNSPGTPFITMKNASTTEAKYCNAIALKNTGGFDIIYAFVGYLFFLVQPFLIMGAVGMIIYCGVEIMYKGGGSGEEAIKKVYKQLQQVLMGLALLFLIKLFLTTVNGLFFTM